MSEVLNVTVRDTRGKRNARRMRREGKVPAVLYGHGEAVISLTVSAEEVGGVVRHGARVVDLDGAVKEKAFIRELQWDVYATHVVHLDFARVSADEKVQVEVNVELRGEAPGTKDGGVVTQMVHHVEIECPVIAIPEKLTVSIKGLNLGSSLTAAEIELPAGATLISNPDAVVVQCALPKQEEEITTGMGESLEPEVIGRQAAEEEADEE